MTMLVRMSKASKTPSQAEKGVINLSEEFPGGIKVHGEATDGDGNTYQVDLKISPKPRLSSLRSWLPGKKDIARAIIVTIIASAVTEYAYRRLYDASMAETLWKEVRAAFERPANLKR